MAGINSDYLAHIALETNKGFKWSWAFWATAPIRCIKYPNVTHFSSIKCSRYGTLRPVVMVEFPDLLCITIKSDMKKHLSTYLSHTLVSLLSLRCRFNLTRLGTRQMQPRPSVRALGKLPQAGCASCFGEISSAVK